MISKILDRLLPSRALRKRNDYLMAANNRLGKVILDLRKELTRYKRRPMAKAKAGAPAQTYKPSTEYKYKVHIEAQRQNHLVKALAEHVPRERFLAECERINNMTDQQIEALK